MTSEQISIITSVFTTLVGTCATLIGLVFVAYTFAMQSRKKSRIDREEQKKENFIMVVTLGNLLLPMFVLLIFLSLLAFNLNTITSNGLLKVNLQILSYLSLIIICIIFLNILLPILLKKTYRFVSGIGVLISFGSILIPIANYLLFGINLSLKLAIVYTAFLLAMTVLQIWTYINISSYYKLKKLEES
ncbi:hypothetical protein G5B47_20515 [Paenibacillus sp. 7124]|uniref:Uncharacterized protein n=1 Tax=Paenibacillus apii TaxID=1850370 RepID=A0A6M1PNF8_9BACL|nr:hypothetical protein [Paenibacillus apii]NGM84790.1 hypothetical protein [Paenibacillus apii]